MSWVFGTLGSIPVGRRGVDTASTKTAIRRAREGSLVGVFPEGRINTTDQLMLPGRPGAALIALKAGVPVIPCFVRGAPFKGAVLSPFYTPARVQVTVGDPIDVQPYIDQGAHREAQIELTKRIVTEIAKLAGVENYQPELAGRLWGPADDEARTNGGASSET
jgi:1-acyl-sn-glycerol-3-phosphate acyltransferase